MCQQVRVKVRDSGIPACETPAVVTIRVARNEYPTRYINLPQSITITQSRTGVIYTVRSADSDLKVCYCHK